MEPAPAPEASGGNPIVGVALTEVTDTLLQLVQVRVHGPKGDRDVVAMLDTGSQISLCCEHVLEDVGIRGNREDLQLQNAGGSGQRQSSLRVQMEVSPLGAGAKRSRILLPEVWSLPLLNVTPPSVSTQLVNSWSHLRDLDLPQYGGEPVELLLGANVLEALLQREVRVGDPGQPVAVRTDFGWTLSGSVTRLSPASRQIMFVGCQAVTGHVCGTPAKARRRKRRHRRWRQECIPADGGGACNGTRLDSREIFTGTAAMKSEKTGGCHKTQAARRKTKGPGDRQETGAVFAGLPCISAETSVPVAESALAASTGFVDLATVSAQSARGASSPSAAGAARVAVVTAAAVGCSRDDCRDGQRHPGGRLPGGQQHGSARTGDLSGDGDPDVLLPADGDEAETSWTGEG